LSLSNKIPPPIVALICALLIYVSADLTPRVIFAYQPMFAGLFAVVGVAVLVAAIIAFAQLKTTVNPLKPKSASALVITGVYKLSRNPMYLAMLLLIMSVWVFTGAISGIFLLPSFVVYINFFQILPEEQAMKELFPEAYPVYCQQVRRWI
jgi:protein-S-isoprenylcysteine O-methyltransferase Ste14